jgi:predicted DNA-binding transcriptional regulator AlpA
MTPWLRVADIAASLGVSRWQVYHLMERPDFPRPFRPSGPKGYPRWDAAEVEEWRRRVMASRE